MAVVFLCQETAHAAGGAADAARRPAVVPVSALSASAALEAAAANPALLPSAADAVRAERFVPGTNGRLIVLLRDAHANLSAQKNIFKAAEFWARQAGIDLILSEAAWGEAGLGDARGVLPAAELKRASDRLLWENLITGHEYLTLVSELPVRVVGIEDPRLYRRNWEVFRRMVSGRERVGGALARSRAAVDGMKRRDYPKALLDHEAAAGRNEDWVLRYRAIRGLAAGSDVLFDAEAESALEPFHAAEAMERSIDHDRLAKEQELALGGARTRCGPCADDLMEAFKKAGPSVAALHSAVGRLTRASGLDARGPASELVRYQRYLESVEALDPAALDAALDTLEEDLYAGLARSRDARVTRFVDRHTRLLESAYRLRLTPEEVRRLGTELLRVRPVSWQAEVNDRLIEQGRVEDILAYEPEFASRLTAVRNFYRLAALRDRVFVRRSDEVLTASGERAALVVTGGYHTDRLTELFAKRGYSVAVFTPYVTEETDQAVYERTVLASDPDRTRPSSGTRLAAGAASPDRSTLLAPLVRTPAGAARLASAIPALPAGPGTLAKELLKIGAGPSAAVPVRSAARMPDADKRDAIQRYVRWHRDQFLGPSAEQFLGPIHFFETPEAFFVFHGGIHAVTTPEQDHAGLVDAYVIENADAFFFGSDEWTRPADFFDHDVQYRGIARAARSAGIPIYLVDTPVVERAPADGPEKSTGPDPAVTARGLFRALLLIAAPLALIFWHPFIGLAFFLAAAHFYAFSFMYEALVHHRQWGIWPLEVLGFLDAGAVGTQRSALAAHKIASVVLPHLREGREGGKPLIWVDWGASHADMVPLLRYPALRTAVLRFERVLHPIRRQPKPDLRYADQAVWMRFEDGPSDRAALVGRVIGPRGQAGRPGGLFAWSFGLTAALHGATSWWTRAALPMPDDIGRNGLFFDVTQHHERLGDWWQAVRATAEEVLGYYSRILGMDYEIVRGDHAPPGVDWERYWLFFIPAAAAYHFVFRRFGPVSRFGSGLALGGWFANHLEGYLRGGVVTNMIQVRSSESVSITNTADIAIAAGVLLVVSAAAFRAVKKLTSNGARMASRQRGKRKKSARPQAAPSIQAKTVTTHLFLEGQGASFTDLAGAKSSIEMIVSNDPAVASGAILTLRSNDLSGHDLRAVHVLQSNEKHRRHPRGPVRIVELESPAWTKRYRSQIRYTIHPSDVVEISAALTKGPPIRLRYKKVKDLMGLMHHEFKRIGDPSRVPIISSAAGPGARMSESPPARTVPGTLFHRIAPAEEAVSIALPETYLEASTKELSEVHLEGLRRDLGLEAPLTPDRARDLIHSSLADPKAWRFLKLLYEFDQRHPSPAGRRDAAYAALERHYREHRWAWPKYHAVHRNKLILKFKRTLAEGTGREKLIREAGLTALPENADPVEALMARLPLRDQIVLRRYYTLGVFGTSDAEKLSVPAQILADVRSRAPEDRDRWKSEDNLSAYRRNLVRELKEHAAKRPDSRLIKLPRRLLRDGRSFADGREVLAHDAGLLPTALTEERFRVLEPFDRLAVEVHYALTDRSLSLEDAVTEVLAVMRSAGLTPPPIMTEGGLTYRVGRAVELLSRYADGWERLRGELFGASAPAADEVRRRVESLPPLSARVLMADHGIGVQASGDDGDLARSLTAETGAPVSIDQVREARWNGWHAIGAEKGDERLKSALWLYGREAVNATPPAEEGAVRVFIWSPAVSGAWRPSGRAGFGPAAAVQKHKLYLPGRDVTEEVWSVDWKPEAGGTYAELMEFLKLSPAARMYPGVTGVDELSSSAPFDPASARPVHGSVITVRPAPEDVYQIPSAPSASPRLREEFWKSVPAADPAKDIVISANGLERLLEGRRALLLEHFAELPDPFEYPEGSITMGPFRFELKRNRYTPVWTLERTQRNLDELARVTGRRLKTEASAEAKRAESERQAAERKEIRELLLDANAPARSRRFSLPVRGRTIFLFKAADDKGVSRDAEIALPPVEGPVYFRVLRSRAGGRYIAVYEEATRKPVILNRFDGHAKFTRHRTALPYRRQVAKQVPTDSPRTAAEPRPVRTKAEKKPRVPKPAAASKNTRPVRLKRSAPNAPSAAGPKGPAAAEPRPAAKDALKETLTSVALRRDAQHFQILMYFKRTGIEGRRFGRFIDGFDAASNNSGHLPQEINRNALFRHAQYAAGSDLPLYRVTLDEGQLDWSALQIFEALGYSKDRAFDPATHKILLADGSWADKSSPVLIRLRDIRAVAFDPPGPAVPSAPAADPGPPALSGARMAADGEFRKLFRDDAQPVIELVIGHPDPGAVVTEYEKRNWYVFDAKRHPRLYRYTYRLQLRVRGSGGTEKEGRVFVKYSGDENGTPITASHPYFESTRDDLSRELAHSRLAHQAGVFPPVVRVGDALVTLESGYEDINTRFRELRGSMPMEQRNAKFIELAQETGKALGTLHSIRRPAKDGSGVEGYLVHLDLNWIGDGPSPLKDHIRVRPDGSIEFIDLGMSEFRDDKTRLFEFRLIGGIVTGEMPAPIRAEALAAYEAAYERAMSGARMAGLPDEALTADTPVREFAKATGLWERGRVVRTFAEPESGFEVHEVEAEIDFESEMPEGTGILRELFDFKWQGLGVRRMRFYVLFDERRMPAAIYPKEGQVPPSIWQEDLAKAPAYHRRYYERIDLSPYTLPTHVLRDAGAGLSRTALRAEFDRVSRLRERVKKFDEHYGTLDQAIPGRPVSESILANTGVGGAVPYVYLEWDTRHHRLWALSFNEKALEDPDSGLRAFHRAQYTPDEEIDKNRFFERLFGSPERPRAVWVQYPWVYPFQRNIGVDKAFRREVYETLRLEAATRLKDGDAVADVGTGTGVSLWVAWLAGLSSGLHLRYFASDLNPMAAANARFNFRLNGMTVDTSVADVMNGRDGRTAFAVPVQFLLANAPASSGPAERADDGREDRGILQNTSTLAHYDGGDPARRFWDRLIDQIGDPRFMDARRGTVVIWNKAHSSLFDRIRSMRAAASAERIPADGTRDDALGYATYQVRLGPKLGRLGERLEIARADLGAAYGLMLRAVQNLPERERGLYLRLAFPFYLTLPTIGVAKYLPMAALAASGHWWATLAAYYAGPIVRLTLMLYYRFRHRLPMGRAITFSLVPQAGTFLALPAQVLDRESLSRAKTVGRLASDLRKAAAHSVAPSRVRRTVLAFSLRLADAVADRMEEDGDVRQWTVLGPGASRRKVDRELARGRKVLLVGYRGSPLAHDFDDGIPSSGSSGGADGVGIHHLDLGLAASALVSDEAPQAAHWIKPISSHPDGARMALSARPGELVKRAAPVRDGVEVSVFEVDGLPAAVNLGVPGEGLSVTVAPLLKTETVAAYLERGGMSRMRAFDAAPGRRTTLWIETQDRMRSEVERLSAKSPADSEAPVLESGVLGTEIARGWTQFLKQVGADADAKSVYIVTPYGELPPFEDAGGEWTGRAGAARMADPSGDGFIWIHTTGLKKWFKQHVRAYLKFMKELPDPAAHGSDTWTDPGSGLVFRRDRDSRNRTYWKLPVDQLEKLRERTGFDLRVAAEDEGERALREVWTASRNKLHAFFTGGPDAPVPADRFELPLHSTNRITLYTAEGRNAVVITIPPVPVPYHGRAETEDGAKYYALYETKSGKLIARYKYVDQGFIRVELGAGYRDHGNTGRVRASLRPEADHPSAIIESSKLKPAGLERFERLRTELTARLTAVPVPGEDPLPAEFRSAGEDKVHALAEALASNMVRAQSSPGVPEEWTRFGLIDTADPDALADAGHAITTFRRAWDSLPAPVRARSGIAERVIDGMPVSQMLLIREGYARLARSIGAGDGDIAPELSAALVTRALSVRSTSFFGNLDTLTARFDLNVQDSDTDAGDAAGKSLLTDSYITGLGEVARAAGYKMKRFLEATDRLEAEGIGWGSPSDPMSRHMLLTLLVSISSEVMDDARQGLDTARLDRALRATEAALGPAAGSADAPARQEWILRMYVEALNSSAPYARRTFGLGNAPRPAAAAGSRPRAAAGTSRKPAASRPEAIKPASQKPSLYSTWAFSHAGIKYSLGKPLLKMLRVDPDRVPADGVSDQLEVVIERKEGQDPRISIKSAAHPSTQIIVLRADDEKPVVSDRILTPGSSRRELSVWDVLQNQKEVPGLFVTDLAPSLSAPKPPPARDLSKARATKQDRPAAVKVIKPASPAPTRTPAFRAVTAPLPKPVPEPAEEIDLDALERTVNARRTHEDVPVVHLFIGKGVRASAPRARIEAIVRATSEGLKQIGLARRIWTLPADDPSIDAHYVVEIDPQRVGKYTITADDLMSVLSFNGDASRAFLLTKDGWRRSSLMSPGIGQLKGLVIAASGARMASRKGGKADDRSGRALRELRRAKEAVRHAERAAERARDGVDLPAVLDDRQVEELKRIRDKYAYDKPGSVQLNLSRRAAVLAERAEPTPALSGEAFQALVARSAERAELARMSEDPEGRMRAVLGKKYAERLKRLLGAHHASDRVIAWDEAGEEVKEYRSEGEFKEARRVVTRHTAVVQPFGAAPRRVTYYLKRWDAPGAGHWMLRWMADASFKRQEAMARIIRGAALGPETAFIGRGLAVIEDGGRPLSEIVADREASMGDRVRVAASVGEALGLLHSNRRSDLRGRVRYLTHGDLVSIDDSSGDPADILNDHIRLEPGSFRATFIDPGLASFEDDAGRSSEKDRLQQTLSRWADDAPGSMVLYDAFESAYRAAFQSGPSVGPPAGPDASGRGAFSSFIKRWIGYIGWGGIAAFTAAALLRFDAALYWDYIWTTAVYGWTLTLAVMSVSLLNPGRIALALSAALIAGTMIALRVEALEPRVAQSLTASTIAVMAAILVSKLLYTDAAPGPDNGGPDADRERLRRAAVSAVWWSAAATPLARLYIGLFWNPFIQRSGMHDAWDKTIFDLGFASTFVHVPLALLINLVYGELKSVGTDLLGGGWRSVLRSGPVRSLNRFYPVNSVFWMAALPMVYGWSGDDRARLLIASSVATAIFVFLVEKPLRSWYAGARMSGREELLERDRRIGAELDLAVERIMNLDVIRSARSSGDWPVRRRVAEALERSGADLKNGYRYLDHGLRYVVFQNDAYPGLVFKKLKHGTPKRIYYEAWLNWLLIIKADPAFQPLPVSAAGDAQGWPLLRLPSVAGYAFSAGAGPEFVVQEHVQGRKAMASDSRTAVDAAAKGLEKLGVVWRDSAAGNFKVTADGGVVIVDTGDQSFQLQEAALGRLVEAAALPADYLPPTDEAIDSALRAVMGPGEYQMLFTGPNRSAREPVSEDRKKILNGLRATAVFYHAIVSGLPAEAAADETLKYIKWLNRPADPAPMPPSVRAVVIHPGAIDHKRITSLWNGYDGSVEVMNLDPGTAREARAAAVERPTGFVVLHLRSDRLDEHGEISATIPAHVREFVTGAQSRKGPAVPVIINIPHRAAEGVLQELERWKETGLIRDHVMLGSGQGIAEHLDLAWLAAAYPDRVWTRLIRPIPGGWELRSRASGAALKASYGRTDTGWGSWSRPRFNLTIEITPPAEPAAKFVFKAAREEDIELVPSENGDHQIIIRRLAENAPLAPAAAALAAFRIRIEPASGARMADAAERIDRAVAARKDEWYGRRITNGVIGRWVGLSKDRVRDMRVEKRLAPATERVIADHEKFAMSWASPHRILAAAEQVAAAGGPLTWDAVAAAMRDHPQWSKNPDRPRSLKKLAANLPHYLQQNPWLKTRIQALKDGSAAVRPGRPMNRERHDLDALKARVEALLPGLDKRGRTVRGTADRPIFEALASLIGEAKAVPVGRSLPRLTDSEVARRSGFSRQTLYVRLGDSMSGAPLERTFNAFLADYDAIRMRREAHLLEGFLDRLVRTGSQVNPSLEYLTLEAPVSAASVRALIKPGSALSEKGRKNYERLKNRHRSRLDRAIVRAAADLIRANGPRTRITHLALAERMRENGFTGSRKEATLDSLRQSVTLRFRNDPGLTRSVRELRSAARMSGGGVLEPAADHRRLELSGVTSGPELSRRYAEYVSHLVSVRGLAPIEALSQAGSEAGDALLAGRVGRMTFLRGLQWFGPIGSYLPRFETSAVEFMKVFNGGHARVSAPAHEWLIGSIAPELLSRKKAGAGRPYVLVIAGRSGSGKSTLAQDVKKGAEGLGIASAVVSMDDFLLDRKTRILRGLRGRDSFDQEAVTRVFGRMAAGEAADLPRTEAVGRNISSFEAVDFGSIDLVIVEGAEPLEFESVAGIADRRILLYESGETQYLSRHWRDQEERGFGPFEIAYSWITRGLREQGSVLGSSIERYDQLIYKSRQPAAMGVSGRPWRLLRKKVPSAPREPAAAARMSDRPRPIDELTWDDADEVTAHFKALLALFNIGTPRAVIRDGAAVSSFSTPSPITAQALSELSAYGSTPARLYSTLRSHLIIAAELEAPGQADWFHERFGTNRSGAVWFEYHDGVRERIYRYVEERAAAGQRGFRILVQGTANGEDAAAMAVLLDHRFPDLKFDVIGKDVLRPKPGDLNWFSESRVPAELKDGADKYFDVKGEVQDENKKPVRILGLKRAWADRLILEQGDIIRPDPKARDMDIVVSTRLLFHAVTREEDLRSAIRNVRASLKAGGLFVLQAADSRSGAETSFMKREFGANFDAEGKGVYRAMASGSRMSVRPIPVLDRLHQARTRARERVDAAPGRAWILILPEIILGALFGALFIGWGVPAFFAAAGLLVLSLAWHELGHRAAMLFLEWRAYRSGRGPFGVIRIDWPRLQVSIANSHEFSMDLITLKTVALAGPVATWMLAVGFWVLEFVRLAGGPELLPRYMGLWAAFMNIFFWFHHMSPRSGSGGDHPLAFWAAGVTRLIRDAGVRYGIDLLPAISGGFVLSSDLKQVYYIRQLNSGPARVPGTLPLRFTIEGYPAPGKFFRIPVRGKLIRTLEGKAIVRTRQARYALYKVEGIPPSALNRYRTVRGRSAARMSVVRPEEFDDFRNAEWILFDPRSFGRKDPERLRVEQKVRKVRFDRRSTRLQSKARELIKEIGLPETGAVAVLGPQDRNLADRRFHRHVHWEEVLAGTDKPIHIYEPEAVSRIAWKEWAGRPGRTGKWIIHQAGAERGDNAHFQYDKTSVGPDLAAVVAVSVFSSPFLYKGERGALARALAGRLQPGALLIIGWYSDRHDHPEIKQEVERTRSSLMAIQRHLSRRGLSLRLEALMREPQSPKMHDLVVYKVNGIGGPERGPQTRKVRAATSAARMAKKAERVKWTSLEDKIAGIGRDWNRDALQKVEMSRRALEALLGRELMPSRMRRLEAGEAAVRALIEAARQALLQADGWTSISREELAALTAIRVPGFDRKRLDRLIHQMNAAQFPEFGRMVDEVTRYSPRTAEIPHKLLEYRQSFRGSRPDLADFDPFVRAAEVSGQKTAVKYQMTRDPYLNRAWKLTASAMRGDAARERKAAVKPEAMTGSSEGARLAVLPPRAARADELAAAPYEVPNGTFFEDPMNLRRLPGRFAMTVRVPGPTPGSLDPVAVIAAPAAGRAAMPASGPRLVFFADRGLPLPSAHLRLREPLIDVRSSASVLASPKDAAIAGHLDHAQVFSRIHETLWGAPRYAVHDVARYWDREVLGAPDQADEHYKLLLNDLREAVLGHKNWKVRFTYRGLPLDERTPDHFNRHDRRLFHLARKALLRAGAHASGPFPQNAHVIGDVDVDTANEAADDPEILTMNGWSGAVISRSTGLRPSVPTLLLQLSLSSNAPIRSDDPVLDLLRMLTGRGFSIEEADALRRGEFGVIRSLGDLTMFAIQNMGARLTRRLEEAAKTAFAAGSSA